jgi:AcrR family transcriptional regulator
MSTIERETTESSGDLRDRIVEAARDIVGELGLDGLSMRALAVRIEHSPATIYHHFRDKEELLGSVMAEGFARLGSSMSREMEEAGPEASPLERYGATGRAYARFALENTGYFRAMFEVPGVAQLDKCPEHHPRSEGDMDPDSFAFLVELIAKAVETGEMQVDDPERAAVIGWGLVHGLTSLYVSGRLGGQADTHEEFMELVDGAIKTLGTGWMPRKDGHEDAPNG